MPGNLGFRARVLLHYELYSVLFGPLRPYDRP
jgi:hypothetical protein